MLLEGEKLEALADTGCEACLYSWALWLDIIEKCGDPLYGTLAARAFEMLDYVETFRIPPSDITEEDWAYMQAVRRVRRNLETARLLQARETRTREIAHYGE